MGRIAGLDGIRGIACLMVLVVHIWAFSSPDLAYTFQLQALAYGLNVFFVLSGFLIFLPFARAILDGRDRPRASAFFEARVRRVFPGYLVIFLLANFALQASYVTNPSDLETTRSDVGSGMITDLKQLGANLSLLHSLWPGSLQTGINPSWSLTTELCYYVVLWLLCLSMFWLRARRTMSRAALAALPALILLVVGIIGKSMVAWSKSQHPEYSNLVAGFGDNSTAVLSRSLLAFADNFAFGMIAVILWLAVARDLVSRGRVRQVKRFAVILVVTSPPFIVLVSTVAPVFGDLYVGVVVCALLILVTMPIALGQTPRLAQLLDWRPFAYVGKVSLSVYLWHFPVLLLLARGDALPPESAVGTLGTTALVIVICLALATATYTLVERPFHRLTVRRPT